MFGRRIAQKLWLGYAIPLAVFVVAGLLVPAALAAILGQVRADYERQTRLVEHLAAMERAALDSRTPLRGYELTRDAYFRRQYLRRRRDYQTAHDAVKAEIRTAPALAASIAAANRVFQGWHEAIGAPILAGKRPPRPGDDLAFQDVITTFRVLQRDAERMRDLQGQRAASAARVQRSMILIGPAASLLLALLIGRSISMGIARPLEALTRATEALERGAPVPPLVEGEGSGSDDELDDLKRSFQRMIRTIGQREAVLRAQNDSLGALNRRVEALLNASNDGIVMLDRAGGFSVINQRFADIVGLDAEALLDHTIDRAAPLFLERFKDPREVRRLMNELQADPEAVTTETVEMVQPEYRVLRVYSAPVRGDTQEILGRIFVFRDATRETMVDRMKTEFVSTVSHELRTPLTAIKGYVDVMLAGKTGPLNDLQTEFLTTVQTSTHRLGTLINDMLDISRIESGRMEVRREPIDYARIVRETAATLANAAEEKGLSLTVDVPERLPSITADPDRVMQVLINLISNAIKYTPSGGSVTVSTESSGTVITTCVSDTGIGISPADQERLFQKFFRADNSTTRETSGTGLGLAITKSILERLNGSIRVESEPGRGSTFCFTLPTDQAKKTKSS